MDYIIHVLGGTAVLVASPGAEFREAVEADGGRHPIIAFGLIVATEDREALVRAALGLEEPIVLCSPAGLLCGHDATCSDGAYGGSA